MNEQCLSMKKISTVLFTYILQFITHWAADKIIIKIIRYNHC